MDEQLIVTLNVGQLRLIVAEAVNEAVRKIQSKAPDVVLLKRKDVAKLFQVSLVTIHEWMKEGRLPFHRMHSRVFFKQSEIMALLEEPIRLGRYNRKNLGLT